MGLMTNLMFDGFSSSLHAKYLYINYVEVFDIK